MILRGSVVVNLINAVAPLYLSIALGYASTKLRVLPFEACFAGINGFAVKFAVPFLVFRLMAASDPYQINMRLIGADVFSKGIVLLVLGVRGVVRPTTPRYFAWLNSIFSLTGLPNHVLIGIPLLTTLYPGYVKFLATLIFMQLLLWYNVCILFLEIYRAVSENSAAVAAPKPVIPRGSSVSTADVVELAEILTRNSTEGKQPIQRKSSVSTAGVVELAECLARRSTESKQTLPRWSSVSDSDAAEIELAEIQARKSVENPFVNGVAPDQQPQMSFTIVEVRDDGSGDFVTLSRQQQAAGGVQGLPGRRSAAISEEGMAAAAKKRRVAVAIALVVLQKMVWSPLVWASLLGFIYSLLNFKFHGGKPLPISLRKTIDMIADCALGLCMFVLGMNMGVSPKLIACGIPKALLGAGLRFIAAPAITAVTSLTVGLRGDMFRFSVMQAMVPQAIVCFVFAAQYDVHLDIFATAVWFQTFIFLPFAIGLNALLNLGASN